MNFPPYPFVNLSDADEAIFYAFTSVSQQKAVQKVVVFTPAGQHLYNMALADVLDSGELSDIAISDNQDMEQVLATVIQVLLTFLKTRPTTSVLFAGSTPRRTRLYRAVINRHLSEIALICQIDAITANEEREPFQPNQHDIGFVVSLL